MYLAPGPTGAVKGACKGVHRSEAKTLYSAARTGRVAFVYDL